MADLRHLVAINATPDKVYAALATQVGMRSWWTADTRMDETVGGKAEFRFEQGRVVFRMTIDNLDPSVGVIMRCHGDQPEWTGTTLTWDIIKGDGVTTLRFVHGGWREITDFCTGCNSMWGNLMYRLKDSVEGRGRGPQWTD